MKALVLYAPRTVRLVEMPLPKLPEGWCLIKTVAVGICGTDKAFYLGTYPLLKKPLVPGHEACGVVVSGCRDLEGELVVPEINFACRNCEVCFSGLYTHCPNRKTLGIDFDGAMAEYFVAPSWALHRVKGLDPLKAVLVEPLAALLNALRQAPPSIEDECAVIGTGSLAYMLAQLLRLAGFNPLIVHRGGSVKAKHFQRKGFRTVDVETAIKDFSNSMDVVFEVSGSPEALDIAIELAKPRGLIHLKSTPGSPTSSNLTKLVVKELRIYGTRCGTFKEFEKAIDLLRKGLVEPPPLKVLEGLDKGVQAFEESLNRNVFKVVLSLNHREHKDVS